MKDLLYSMLASNLLLAFGIALVAWTVQKRGKQPVIAHLLWLLVLCKLLTPALVNLPVLSAPMPDLRLSQVQAPSNGTDPSSAMLSGALHGEGPAVADSAPAQTAAAQLDWTSALLWIWLAGSAAVFALAAWRVLRFQRLLGQLAVEAPQRLSREVTDLSQRLGRKHVPKCMLVPANLPPMLWSFAGRPRIVLPQGLLKLSQEDLRMVLAHEVAHLARRDHWVRWVELLANVLFWWNPATWWACANLRKQEEILCDELVMQRLRPKPSTYANALLNALDTFTQPEHRPPVLASSLDSGGNFETRLNLIMTHNKLNITPRWIRNGILACAAVLLPIGIAQAQEPHYEAIGDRLIESIESGEITASQAEAMMGALARQRFSQRLAAHQAQQEATPKKAGDLKALFKEKGFEEGHYQEVKELYLEKGIPAEKLDAAFEVTLRAAHGSPMLDGAVQAPEDLKRFVLQDLQLSEQQAQMIAAVVARLQHGMEEPALAVDSYPLNKAQYEKIEERLYRAVQTGSISKEEAKKQIDQFSQGLDFAQTKPRQRTALQQKKMIEDFARRKTDIINAMQSGAMTHKDGLKALEDFEKHVKDAWQVPVLGKDPRTRDGIRR